MAKPSRLQSQSLRSKGRKLRSEVWQHFDKIALGNGEEQAICNGCKKKFVGSSKKGTSHLKSHWKKRCPNRKNRDLELNVMDLQPKVAEGDGITSISSDRSNAIWRGHKEDVSMVRDQTMKDNDLTNEKIQPVNAKPYLEQFPDGLRSYICDIKDVKADDSRKEIAMAFVNNNHFVEVVMSQNHPVPRAEPRWSKCRDACAVGWDVAYTSRIEQFERFILPNEKEVENLD